jgi:hypothetical protein
MQANKIPRKLNLMVLQEPRQQLPLQGHVVALGL